MAGGRGDLRDPGAKLVNGERDSAEMGGRNQQVCETAMVPSVSPQIKAYPRLQKAQARNLESISERPHPNLQKEAVVARENLPQANLQS